MKRGYSAIGLMGPKNKTNVGHVLRAAWCYDSSLVVIQGARVNIHQCTDTPKAWRHMPVLRTDDLYSCIPFSSIPVAVDLVDGATPLPEFEHPERAFYIFGPEDGTLEHKTLEWCEHKVMIPTTSCMNLSATVNVVLYDRLVKRAKNQ